MNKLIVFGLLGFVLIACAQENIAPNKTTAASDRFKTCCNQTFNGTGAYMPNPASVYCSCIGGTETNNETPAGAQGICTVNAAEHDEWQLFRENCGNK